MLLKPYTAVCPRSFLSGEAIYQTKKRPLYLGIVLRLLKISTKYSVQYFIGTITFMLMRTILITISVAFLFSIEVVGQNPGTAIIHEPAFRYTITAPSGWVYDEEMAREMRLNMVFYPDTTKWTKSPIVMYVNTTLKLDSNQTLEDVAEMDIINFSGDSPGVKAQFHKSLSTYPQGMEGDDLFI